MGEEMAEICMKSDYLLYRTQWHTEVLALSHRLQNHLKISGRTTNQKGEQPCA